MPPLRTVLTRRPLPVAAVALAAAFLLSACGGTDVGTRPSPTSPPSSAAAPTPAASAELEDAFAERDRFFREQQFASGATTLSAVTPAQKDFIAQQRAYLESQGAVWSDEYETIYLALTADACETSILNGHEVDTDTFTTHIQTSPLVTTILQDVADEQRSAATANLASVMVFGTTFLCPADAPQWEAAYTEVFG